MANNIIDFVSKRKESIERKRRRFERILFKNFFSIETTISKENASCPIDLVDVSYDGCLFRVLEKRDPGFVKVGKELTLKIYFTEYGYISVSVGINRTAKFVEKDGHCYREYGCKFDKSLTSFRAMEAFVDFLYKFAECSCTDYGDKKIYSL